MEIQRLVIKAISKPIHNQWQRIYMKTQVSIKWVTGQCCYCRQLGSMWGMNPGFCHTQVVQNRDVKFPFFNSKLHWIRESTTIFFSSFFFLFYSFPAFISFTRLVATKDLKNSTQSLTSRICQQSTPGSIMPQNKTTTVIGMYGQYVSRD